MCWLAVVHGSGKRKEKVICATNALMSRQFDMATWLIQAAPANDCSDETIATMLMNLNLASIYSTSMVSCGL